MKDRIGPIIVLAMLVVVGSVQAELQTADPNSAGLDGPILANPFTPIRHVQPFGMLHGDFNEDGLEDLAAIGGTGLLILLADGDGSFSETYYGFNDYGNGAIGDFNEDGHQDLALAKGSGANVMLGNGDGTFAAPISLRVPDMRFGFGVAVADFDHDDNEDIVVESFDSSNPIGFFAGNGDGTFSEPVLTMNQGQSLSIAVGDFDEDGNLDFVGTNVWLGLGNGSFVRGGTGAQLTLGLGVFDFDGDTHLDLAKTSTFSFDPARVLVRLGNGDGTFGDGATYDVGDPPLQLLVHDVESDGNADLLVSHPHFGSRESQDAISVLPGNGDGTFGPKTEIPLLNSTGPMAIADLDDDGYDDLAAIQSSSRQLIVLYGHADGFSGADPATVRTYDPGGDAVRATFGDVNRDGLPDVVRVRDDPGPAVGVLVADGSGGFDPSASAELDAEVSDVAIGNLDNGPNPDVIVTHRETDNASILLGNGDGSFAPPFSIPLAVGPSTIVIGRFDDSPGDDLAVLAVAPAPFGVTLHPAVNVYSRRGNASFSLQGTSPVGSGPFCFYCDGNWIMQAGDFNEDNQTDLVLHLRSSTEISILIGRGDGTFQPEVRYEVPWPTSLLVGDVNGDGHEDFLLGDTYDEVSGEEGNKVLYGAGDGNFAAAVDLIPGAPPTRTWRLGDLNGDGLVDLVTRAPAGVSLRLGHGNGAFGEPSFFQSANGHVEMVLDDADGDGRLDVLVTDRDETVTSLNICEGCDGNLTICHRSQANRARAVTLRIARSALPAHLAHGDVVGACPAGSTDSRIRRGHPAMNGRRSQGTIRTNR